MVAPEYLHVTGKAIPLTFWGGTVLFLLSIGAATTTAMREEAKVRAARWAACDGACRPSTTSYRSGGLCCLNAVERVTRGARPSRRALSVLSAGKNTGDRFVGQPAFRGDLHHV